MPTYATPIFTTEELYFVTYIQLFQTTAKAKVILGLYNVSLLLLGCFLQCTSMLRLQLVLTTLTTVPISSCLTKVLILF